MSTENVEVENMPGQTAGENDRKDELQQQMGETREAISRTVADIKQTVSDQVQSVKDVFDWREQFRHHPLEWCAGALVLGFIGGYNLNGMLADNDLFKRLQKEIAAIGDNLVDQLSDVGNQLSDGLGNISKNIVPAITGAAIPIVLSQLKEAIGLDLSDAVTRALTPPSQPSPTKKKKKKNGSKEKKHKNKKKADLHLGSQDGQARSVHA